MEAEVGASASPIPLLLLLSTEGTVVRAMGVESGVRVGVRVGSTNLCLKEETRIGFFLESLSLR